MLKSVLEAWWGFILIGLDGMYASAKEMPEKPMRIVAVCIWLTWAIFWALVFPFVAPFILLWQKR